MKSETIKKLSILALAGYTALVGTLGFRLGKSVEKSSHVEDGLVFTVRGREEPTLDITARFGSDKIQMSDLHKYAKELAPYGSFASQAYAAGEKDAFADSMRYFLLGKDNFHNTFPERFKVVSQRVNYEEASVKVVPGVDTEFKSGNY
ncbi:hypothetical protein HY486_00900 [Candidatus Woesearchaeota archaeon]|nr:hypothetical protein [Candidatus Woesearchaeota archaeon]